MIPIAESLFGRRNFICCTVALSTAMSGALLLSAPRRTWNSILPAWWETATLLGLERTAAADRTTAAVADPGCSQGDVVADRSSVMDRRPRLCPLSASPWRALTGHRHCGSCCVGSRCFGESEAAQNGGDLRARQRLYVRHSSCPGTLFVLRRCGRVYLRWRCCIFMLSSMRRAPCWP